MFTYSKDGMRHGFVVSDVVLFSSIMHRKIRSFSVDENLAKKKLKIRRILSHSVLCVWLAIPLISAISAGIVDNSWGTAFGFLFLGLLGLMLLAFPVMSIIDELSDESFYLKYSDDRRTSLDHPDYNLLSISSSIYAENATYPFWTKFFRLDNKELLQEGTSIMIAERQLLYIIKEATEYLSESNNSIIESDIRTKLDEAKTKLDNLSDTFETYMEKVLSHIEDEKDIKVIELVSKVDDIAA